METMLEWLRGPLFRFSFMLMVLGLIRHLIVEIIGIMQALRKAGDRRIAYGAVIRATASWLFPVTKVRDRPFYSISSILFHVGVILVPLFAAAHVLLFKQSIGIGWISLSQSAADFLTVLTIITGMILFISRISLGESRALSRFQDYALPPLIIVPFVFGFLASHPSLLPINHSFLMLVHVLSADILMICIPFTKMSHIVLLPSTQLISEIGWHFPEDMGEQVAVTLQKENQPI